MMKVDGSGGPVEVVEVEEMEMDRLGTLDRMMIGPSYPLLLSECSHWWQLL
jgi:hypothetical protein